MSDCKHEKRTRYASKHPLYVSYCPTCDADFTQFELETLERAEKAEVRVKELEADLHEHNKTKKSREESYEDGYDQGWKDALEIAKEKITRIER